MTNAPTRHGDPMLSTKSAAVVKATLPVIGAAIGDITPVFYKRMFAAHPELERDLFNRGNQAQGDQQSALAGAIAANRCSWTIGYWSSVMPSEACLWAMRLSITSGRVSGCSTRCVAKAAIEPASA